jgi:ATP-dependent Clp protease protease subunit
MSKELMFMPPLPAGGVLEANNIYLFMEEFTAATVKPVIEFILSKNLLPAKQRPPHLTLIINSPGGEVASAFALIDTMKGSAIPIHTVGLGEISSCGILTFMNGAKGFRTLTPNTMILSHQFSGWAGGKEHELAARTTHFKQVSDRIMHSYKVATGLSDDKIKKLLLPPQDVWLTAKEAVKYGLADKIKVL